jgi:hypothetical protein
MEMAGKQFSPFMEMVMQPCFTACATHCLTVSATRRLTVFATVSYRLCNCVLRFMEMAGKQFSPFMEMVMQPCFTACATHCLTNYVTASYGLWKWLATSSPIYGNGFRSGTSKNQRLYKKLGNSENRVTYRLR